MYDLHEEQIGFGSSNIDTYTTKDKMLKSGGRRMKQSFMNGNHFERINFAQISLIKMKSKCTLASSCLTQTMLLTISGMFLPRGGPLPSFPPE